jgi:[acyl-carrier-protein] S-malonyltransferase
VAQPLLVPPGWSPRWRSSRTPPTRSTPSARPAGHSVGEITAAAGTGVISAEQAMVLVRERGRAMADAAARKPTGMTAVLGGDPDEVAAALEQHGLTAPTTTAPARSVAAGTLDQLEAFKADPPAKARLIPLSVAGAFHTEHMAPRSRRSRPTPRPSACTTRAPASSPTATASVVQQGRDVAARIVQPGEQPGALGPAACAPWASSASPVSSRSRRPAP